MRQKVAYKRRSATIRTTAASRASTGERIILTLGISVASICIAIGAWSMLAFINGMAIYGVGGVISGFFRALTGQ